jgi:hypothetical protein
MPQKAIQTSPCRRRFPSRGLFPSQLKIEYALACRGERLRCNAIFLLHCRILSKPTRPVLMAGVRVFPAFDPALGDAPADTGVILGWTPDWQSTERSANWPAELTAILVVHAGRMLAWRHSCPLVFARSRLVALIQIAGEGCRSRAASRSVMSPTASAKFGNGLSTQIV